MHDPDDMEDLMTDTLTTSNTLSAADCVIRPGEGRKVDSGMTLKINAKDMDGYFGMMEGCLEPKQLLAPHTHERETQAVYVIEGGDLEFEVGGEGGLRFTAGVDCYVIKPKGVEHCFWNPGETPVRYIELSTGSNFEAFQKTTDQLNKVKVARDAASKFEMVIHVERIPTLLERHGLTSVSGVKISGPLHKVASFLGAIKP